MLKEIIKGILAIGIVGAVIYGFLTPEINETVLQVLVGLTGIVVGYYYGAKELPLGRIFK